MENELDTFVKNRKLATYKVLNAIGLYNKNELCSLIGVSRPTLNTRLKTSNWRMKELQTIIKKLPI